MFRSWHAVAKNLWEGSMSMSYKLLFPTTCWLARTNWNVGVYKMNWNYLLVITSKKKLHTHSISNQKDSKSQAMKCVHKVLWWFWCKYEQLNICISNGSGVCVNSLPFVHYGTERTCLRWSWAFWFVRRSRWTWWRWLSWNDRPRSAVNHSVAPRQRHGSSGHDWRMPAAVDLRQKHHFTSVISFIESHLIENINSFWKILCF